MTLWQDWSPGKDAGCQKMGNTSDDEQRRSNKEMEANQGAGEVVQQVSQLSFWAFLEPTNHMYPYRSSVSCDILL